MYLRNIDRLPLPSPQLETWPTTQACALTGIKLATFWFAAQCSNPLSHTSQGNKVLLGNFLWDVFHIGEYLFSIAMKNPISINLDFQFVAEIIVCRHFLKKQI